MKLIKLEIKEESIPGKFMKKVEWKNIETKIQKFMIDWKPQKFINDIMILVIDK